jgi:hypothetical protein
VGSLAYVFFIRNFFRDYNIFHVIPVTFVSFFPSFNYDSRWTDEGITGNVLMIWAIVLVLVGIKLFEHTTKGKPKLVFYSKLVFYCSGLIIGLLINTQLKYLIIYLIFGSLLFLYFYKIKIKFLPLLIQFLGIVVALILIELFFLIVVRESRVPIFIQQLNFVFELSNPSNGTGEWVERNFIEMFQLKNVYIFANLLLLIVPAVLWKKKSNSNFLLVFFIISNYIIIYFFQFIIKFPILDTWWYYGTVWPIIGICFTIAIQSLVREAEQSSRYVYFLTLILIYLLIFYISNIYINLFKIDISIILFGIFAILFFYIFVKNGTGIFIVYSVLVVNIFTQFTQPPFGTFNYQLFPGGGFSDKSVSITADQIWLIEQYRNEVQKEVIPIWYGNDNSGYLGSVQSSLGFGLSRLHGLAEDSIKPDLSNWESTYSKPKKILVLDFIDQTYLRAARIELAKEDYIPLRQSWNGDLTLVVFMENKI